jgi:hypothetical protein
MCNACRISGSSVSGFLATETRNQLFDPERGLRADAPRLPARNRLPHPLDRCFWKPGRFVPRLRGGRRGTWGERGREYEDFDGAVGMDVRSMVEARHGATDGRCDAGRRAQLHQPRREAADPRVSAMTFEHAGHFGRRRATPSDELGWKAGLGRWRREGMHEWRGIVCRMNFPAAATESASPTPTIIPPVCAPDAATRSAFARSAGRPPI